MNDRYGKFGAAIKIGKDEVITDFLGESCSLDAYYEAYVTSIYKDTDSGKWIKKFIGRENDR